MCSLAALLLASLFANCNGRTDLPKIVGGTPAAPGEFPHQVSLRYGSGGSHFCGGSIITPRHIVTAAHCVESTSPSSVRVVAGHMTSYGGTELQVKSIRIHPGYTGRASDGWKDDIAVLTLSAPLQFNSLQGPIRLASQDYATGGYRGIISGWGKTSTTSSVAPYLLKAAVGVLSASSCQAAHPRRAGRAYTTAKQICTFERPGIGACQGDSGGPLVVNGQLAGVTSWVAPCAIGIPDVYTNIYHYLIFLRVEMLLY